MNAANQFDSLEHTPGPLEAIDNLVRSPMVHPEGSERPAGVMIAECADGYGLKANSAEATANARLFAASPELFVALQELVNEVQPLGIDRPTYQAALVALSKAQGAPT